MKLLALAAWSLTLLAPDGPALAESRLDAIRTRGHVTCGITVRVAGFTSIDGQGNPSGFEVDLCRAVAAAIFGDGSHVVFNEARTLDEFEEDDTVDLVSRRLTWTLHRDTNAAIRFSPIVFYDGGAFLVRKRDRITSERGLSAKTVCIQAGTEADAALRTHLISSDLHIQIVTAPTKAIAAADFEQGKCAALAADLSELAVTRATAADPKALAILPTLFSKEPLALLMHADDDAFELLVRWTIYALIAAEEMNITAANVDHTTATTDQDAVAFLGIAPGNGKALGLRESWAVDVIRAVGNYGEIFARNIGTASPLMLPRGLNALWHDGGLMYAPPLR